MHLPDVDLLRDALLDAAEFRFLRAEGARLPHASFACQSREVQDDLCYAGVFLDAFDKLTTRPNDRAAELRGQIDELVTAPEKEHQS